MTASHDLLQAFHAGEEVLWQQIVETYSPWLYGLCLRVMAGPKDAEEVLQEGWLLAFQKRSQLRDLEKIKWWLRKICFHACLNRKRKGTIKEVDLAVVEAFIPISSQPAPDQIASVREELKQVLIAMNLLSPRQRACLVLAVFEDMKMDEIAETLDLKSGAVRRYIHDARKRLRKIMERSQ